MLNFLTNTLKVRAYPSNTCGSYNNPNNVIQECTGCDGECLYTCYAMCANQCVENSADSNDGEGHNPVCNDCTSSCDNFVSILLGGK